MLALGNNSVAIIFSRGGRAQLVLVVVCGVVSSRDRRRRPRPPRPSPQRRSLHIPVHVVGRVIPGLGLGLGRGRGVPAAPRRQEWPDDGLEAGPDRAVDQEVEGGVDDQQPVVEAGEAEERLLSRT